MPRTSPTIWRLGDLELSPDAYQLRRGDTEIAVEPRVLDLLVYLVRHRERVVGKDELLAEVWEGQHVSESALTRCVYEARRALGDDASRKQRIKTVYGRGYQYVGPFALASEAGEIEGEAERPREERRAYRGLVAALLVAAAGLGALWRGREAPRSDPGERTQIERLAILPFEVATEVPEAELTALSLNDQLWVRLAAQPGLIVRSRELSSMLRAAELEPAVVLREAEVQALITGRLDEAAIGGRLQLTVELHLAEGDGASRLPVGTYEVPEPSSPAALQQFVRAREAIAEDVIEHLGPLTEWETDPISPRDPEAFELYLRARERFATITCGDAEALLDLLDRSLELDPDFAVTWVARGFALYSQTWSCGRDATFAARALESAERARSLAPTMPGALLLESLLLAETGEVEEAYARILRAQEDLPRSPLVSLARSYTLRYAGFLTPAREAMEETLRLDPIVLRELGFAPLELLYLGEAERFLERLPANDVPHDRFYRGLALARLGREAEARAVLEPAFRLNPSDLFARFSSALLAILEGDDRAGLEIVRGIVRQRRELGTPDGEMTVKEAQLLASAGRGDEALNRLETAVEQGFFCPACLTAEPSFATLRDQDLFQDLLKRARERHQAFGQRFGLPPEPPEPVIRSSGARTDGTDLIL